MDALTGPGIDEGLLLLRVLVGVPFSLHGFQKLLGWFDGGGIDGTAKWFASLGFGDGRSAALMAGASEVAGGLGLAFGLLSPLSAAAMVGTMTTAAFVNNAEAGFWSVYKGWELNGYLIVVAATVAVAGPGAYSLDHALGLEWFAGPLLGGGAVLLGVLGGWVRWASRDRSAD
jgi:putative oxidoreductase